MSTTARLHVDAVPELGGTRYQVDCKFSRTTLIWPTISPIEMDERQQATMALQAHESECGKCNTTRLWRDHGDQELRAGLDDLVNRVQRKQAERYIVGRRN